jgi:uncharacterized protein (DUF362 family)
MNHDPVVFVTRVTHESAVADFRRAFETSVIREDRRVRSVAVKINLCDYRRAESGATTDPVLLGALLTVLRERFSRAELMILENDATTVEMSSMYRLLGIDRIAREHGAILHNVADGDWVTKPVPHGRIFHEIEVPVAVDQADFLVNFAKLKTNALTKTTGCLKNLFALLRTKHKSALHPRIDDVLVDLNRVYSPHLCLVDGYIGMEGIGGPAFGRPKRCELLISGRNPVAVDACCARIMGFAPRTVGHIRLCARAKIGPLRYRLKTDVADFDYRRYRYQFPHWEYRLRALLRQRVGAAQ